MGDFKPIETVYNGYRFRSRLEARWAVFFDVCGIRYVYEPEGFEVKLSDGRIVRYLPDFYFPESGLYGEVKGATCRGQIPAEDAEKMSWMIDFNGPCAKGIVMLGEIPEPGDYMDWAIWRHKGECIVWGYEFQNVFTGDWGCFDQVGDGESAPYSFKPDDDYILSCSCIPDPVPQPRSLTYEALVAARRARFEHGETPQIKRPGSSGN